MNERARASLNVWGPPVRARSPFGTRSSSGSRVVERWTTYKDHDDDDDDEDDGELRSTAVATRVQDTRGGVVDGGVSRRFHE